MKPDYLFHYTSVDVLELILKNRTIRFSPLEKMDDPEEQWSYNGNQDGSHFFISSWSSSEREIPEMWKQYCKGGAEHGVRIKLPYGPFSEKDSPYRDGNREKLIILLKITNAFIFDVLHEEPSRDYLENKKQLRRALELRPEMKKRLAEMIDEKLRKTTVCDTKNINTAYKVTYTDDESLLFPRIYINYHGVSIEDRSVFGFNKSTAWAWQEEWRYVLYFRRLIPGVVRKGFKIELYDIPFDYYDLILDENAVGKMEIMLSPVISDSERIRVKEIIEKYNPAALITESRLESLN